MPTASTTRTWTADQLDRLRRLYTLVEGDEQIACLAGSLGVTVEAMRTQAKRLGLRRPPQPPAYQFTADDDAKLRRAMQTAAEPEEGLQRAAQQIGVSAAAADFRWRSLERRRRARVGDWDEQELAEAVQNGAVAGRDSEETSLRLLTLGVRSAQDRLIDLGEVSDRLHVPFEKIEHAVLAGELHAVRSRTSDALPDRTWVTSEQRIGAWLVAWPNLLSCSADSTWALRMVFACGARLGETLALSASGPVR